MLTECCYVTVFIQRNNKARAQNLCSAVLPVWLFEAIFVIFGPFLIALDFFHFWKKAEWNLSFCATSNECLEVLFSIYLVFMSVGKDFSSEVLTVDFPGEPKNIFAMGWLKLAKFHFTHLKLRKQSFFAKSLMGKCQISKSKGGKPLPTSMLVFGFFWCFWFFNDWCGLFHSWQLGNPGVAFTAVD